MKGTNFMKTKAPMKRIAKRPTDATTGTPTKQPKLVPNWSSKSKAFISGEG